MAADKVGLLLDRGTRPEFGISRTEPRLPMSPFRRLAALVLLELETDKKELLRLTPVSGASVIDLVDMEDAFSGL